jgi:hypothetical protein
VWIGGNEVVGAGVKVGEVATAATGDRDLFADSISMLKDDYFASAFAGFNSTEETRRSSADYYDVFLDRKGRGRNFPFVIASYDISPPSVQQAVIQMENEKLRIQFGSATPVTVFAPEERDVYSPMLSLLFGAPEERNVFGWFANPPDVSLLTERDFWA